MTGSSMPPLRHPAELRLRPEPPRVTRLSRKVLVGLGGVSWHRCSRRADLGARHEPARWRSRPTELFTTENRIDRRRAAEPAAGLYRRSAISGPPLPGDLGRPILPRPGARRAGHVPDIRTPRADPEEQRRLAEIEAARTPAVRRQPRRADATTGARNENRRSWRSSPRRSA